MEILNFLTYIYIISAVTVRDDANYPLNFI